MSKIDCTTMGLDNLTTYEILERINDEDQKVASAIRDELMNIQKAVDIIVSCFERGGRMFYIGSGTSGKIGVIDASECPQNFGIDEEMIQSIISGGNEAMFSMLEHTEDDAELAIRDIEEKKITSDDVLIGITASGKTPYVKSIMEHGRKIGAKTIGLICRKDGDIKRICDLTIAVDVGSEIIMGATRMKAGTAQKMVLNMLSTTAMIKMGKTYSNLMVNVKAINKKLVNRVVEIVQLATEADFETINKVLKSCDYDPKVAIVAIKLAIHVKKAKEILNDTNGKVAEALKNYKHKN